MSGFRILAVLLPVWACSGKSNVCTDLYYQKNSAVSPKGGGVAQALPDGPNESSGKVPRIFRFMVTTPRGWYSLAFPSFPLNRDSVAFVPGPPDIENFLSERPDSLAKAYLLGIPYGLADSALLSSIPPGDKVKRRLGAMFFLETRAETVQGEIHVLQSCHSETDPFGN